MSSFMTTFLGAGDDPLSHVKDVILLEVNGMPILTMHMVTIVIVGVLFVLAMLYAANGIATGPESQGNDRYLPRGRFAQLIESLVVALRDQMLEPVMGRDATRRYLPALLTLFFFILFNNLFGLIPFIDLQHALGMHTTWFGGTATGNLAITAGLATFAFFLIQMHGFRDLGVKGWLIHNFGGLVPGPIGLLPIALLVFVVELMGHIIKPVALAIRLFANMVAGHTLMSVLIGFGAMAAKGGMGVLGIAGIATISGLGAVVITFLELFVAFLQAFIFMFLTAVFISLLSHHEHDEEHEMAEEGMDQLPGHGHDHDHGHAKPAHA